MEFLKKHGFGFYLNVIVVILSIVSLILYVSNVNTAYYKDMNTSVVYMMVVAFIGMIIAIILPQFSDGVLFRVVSDLLRVVVAALIITAGVKFISMRVESFGYIFGSNLELGNKAAFSAANQAVAGIIIFIVTWFLAIVASFLRIEKKKQ
jgi:hypothetical protein